jgi:hypothetical protein
MWLISVPTAVSLFGALVGAGLVRGLTDLPPTVALIVGAIAGWLLAALALAPAAERLDRALHRMGGPRRRGG